MRHALQWARLQPGPLCAMMCAWLLLTGTIVRAHDPGLSSLDVSVRGRVMSATLSIAAADVALMAPGLEEDLRERVSVLARNAVRISIDGVTLRPAEEQIAVDDREAQIHWSFQLPDPSDRVRRVTVSSDLPKRVARGHRELLIVDLDRGMRRETLLDAATDSVTVDLAEASASGSRVAWSFLALALIALGGGYRLLEQRRHP